MRSVCRSWGRVGGADESGSGVTAPITNAVSGRFVVDRVLSFFCPNEAAGSRAPRAFQC